MSSKSSVVLTSYLSKQDSIDTFFSELESIQQSKDSNASHETDEEKDEKEEQGEGSTSSAQQLSILEQYVRLSK